MMGLYDKINALILALNSRPEFKGQENEITKKNEIIRSMETRI
jgi:hypothetical protein